MIKRSHVVVTGASSGFGRLISETLAARGHRVFATMRDPAGRNASAASALAGVATVLELDVSDQRSVDAAIAEAIADAGHIDVVVNNAGVGYVGLLEATTPEQVLAQIEINTISALRVNRAVLPHMRERRSGLLIHMSSSVGRRAVPYLGAYAASKWALEALAETYRYELAHLGVDSVIVEPGVFKTGINDRSVLTIDESPAEAYRELHEFGATILPRRAAGPDAQPVADAVVALVEARPGERPARTTVGVDAKPLDHLNQVSADMQADLFDALGTPELFQLRVTPDD